MNNDVKWLAIMFIGFAAFVATAVGVFNWSESRIAVACVQSGGEWIDIDQKVAVNMGCVRS